MRSRPTPTTCPAAREAITARANELSGLAQAGQRPIDYADYECGLALEGVEGGGEVTVPPGSGATTTTGG